MRRVIGQAAGRFGRTLHRLVRLCLFLMLAVAIGLGALAWRLGQGPLAVPWLADELVAATNRHIAPLRLDVGEAALVWEGFSRGVDRPLDIRMLDVAVFDADGRRVAQVPEIEVSLSTRALATGRIAPRGLLVQGARVRALRNADGSMALDFSGAAEAPATVDAPRADLSWLFEALAQPPGVDMGGRATLLSQLRELQLRDTAVAVQDQALGLMWRVPRLEIDLQRGAEGGVAGTASLDLALDGRRVTGSARLDLPPAKAGNGTLAVEATLSTLVPAQFAGLAPAFAPMAAVEAPVALTATASLGPDLIPRQGRLQARMAGGTLHIARGRVPVTGAMAEIEGTKEAMTVTLRRLVLPGGGAEPTIVIGTATLRPGTGPQGPTVTGVLDLAADRVAFADLASLWPDGAGGPGAKAWVTRNITDGVARNLQVTMRVEAAADLSDGEITSLTGQVEARDAVVHWLRPVPPAEGVAARLTFASVNGFDIDILAGHQAGIAVAGGRVSVTGLAGPDQFLTLGLDLGGPVADLIAVLNHPRVNLLSRRPVTMRNPAGRVDGRLMVSAMPLIDALRIDDVRLSAQGTLAGLSLGGIAAGHDLTAGALEFSADNERLAVSGTAALAGIPSQLSVEMDFTEGQASQVIQKIAVAGTAEATQLMALGLDTKELVLDGSAGLKVELVGRRSGRTEIAVRADLAKLGLRADRLNWGKAAGRAATGEALVVLDRERFAGIERLRIDGEGVAVQGAVDAAGGAVRRLRLTRAALAPGIDVQGEVQWPRGADQPWVVRLSGASLDVSAELKRQEPPGPEVRGPAWNGEVRVDRLILGHGRQLTGVFARAEDDGLVTRSARVTGKAGAGAFEVSILPSGLPQRRSLTVTAQDAGALLSALDVMDDMRGGRMTLSGSFDDSRADHALSGTADVVEFGMRDAPAIGKLLQAITVIGAFEAFSGPDLRFSRLVAPFRRVRDVVELSDARAFSATLGVTAKGRIDMGRRQFDLQGTVVPAYFLNSLLGRVPVLGRLLSPETGGGLFAVAYGVTGSFDDPSVWVNPLTAVTPGFLRGLFEGSSGGGGDAPRGAAAPPREGGQR